jgi:hypothetical protein
MDTTQTPPHGVSRHHEGFQVGRSQVVQWHHVAVCVQGFGRAAGAGPVGDLARRHVLLVPDCQPPVAQVVRTVGGTFTTLQARATWPRMRSIRCSLGTRAGQALFRPPRPGGNSLAHVLPKGRLGAADLFGELIASAGDCIAKVPAGPPRLAAAPTSEGCITEDARELAQLVPPAPEHRGDRLELAQGNVGQGGEGSVQVLVDGVACSSTPSSRLRFSGESSALARSTRTSRSLRASRA